MFSKLRKQFFVNWILISVLFRLTQLILATAIMITLHYGDFRFNYLWFCCICSFFTIFSLTVAEILFEPFDSSAINTRTWFLMISIFNLLMEMNYVIGSVVITFPKQNHHVIIACVLSAVEAVTYGLASIAYLVRSGVLKSKSNRRIKIVNQVNEIKVSSLQYVKEPMVDEDISASILEIGEDSVFANSPIENL